MLARTTESLIEVVSADSSTAEELKVAGQSFFNAIESASVEEVNQAMKRLSSYFDLENPSRAAYLVLVCGALIEEGFEASIIAEALRAYPSAIRS